MATMQPIRSKSDIRALTKYHLERGEFRNHVLVILSLHTALRVSDILRLRWDDVYDFQRKCVRKTITVTEGKTGKTKIIALHKNAIRALGVYAVQAAEIGKFVIENKHTKLAISRVQAYRIIRAAGEALVLAFRVSSHALRKTFGYHAWKGGTPVVVIMEIYNHSSLSVTRRYLGVAQDDKNAVYLGATIA